jgi:hypothetical protein
VILEDIIYFEEQRKRIDITKEEFTIFLQSIPKEDITFKEFDICEDPMDCFIQEITNVLHYSSGGKYTHQVIIKRGPIRTDSPTRLWQINDFAYIRLKRKREINNEI